MVTYLLKDEDESGFKKAKLLAKSHVIFFLTLKFYLKDFWIAAFHVNWKGCLIVIKLHLKSSFKDKRLKKKKKKRVHGQSEDKLTTNLIDMVHLHHQWQIICSSSYSLYRSFPSCAMLI